MTTSTPETTHDDFEALKIIAEALKPFSKEDKERILRWTREKFGIEDKPAYRPTQAAAQEAIQTRAPINDYSGETSTPKDIRTFVKEKDPKSDNQFAATVAYYYRFEAPQSQHKESINADDLQEATRLVGRNRLGDPHKTLRNAHGQGYFDLAERGLYTVSTVGENLVAVALPQADGKVRAPRKAQRKSGKKKPSKKG